MINFAYRYDSINSLNNQTQRANDASQYYGLDLPF